MVGNWSLNRKGREGFVQDKSGWQRDPQQHGGREGRREGKAGKDLFRISVVGNGSLNSTEGGNPIFAAYQLLAGPAGAPGISVARAAG